MHYVDMCTMHTHTHTYLMYTSIYSSHPIQFHFKMLLANSLIDFLPQGYLAQLQLEGCCPRAVPDGGGDDIESSQ